MFVSDFRNRHGQRLDASYHESKSEHCLAVIGHGVTGDKDRPLLVGLANELAARCLPCLRFSFAGNGESEGRFEDATFSAEANDLRDLLGSLPKTSTIIYIGHSMGAAVGAMVAADTDSRIQILVSLAGMVETAAFCRREFGDLTPGQDCMWDEPGCPLSQAYVNDANAIGTILPLTARISQPWLLLHGVDDDVVPVEDSRMIASTPAPGKRQLIEIPGVSHMFSKEAYSTLALAICDWTAKHCDKSG